MSLVLDPFAIPAFVALVAALAMATVVFVTAPTRRQPRRLALVLLIEGIALGSGGGLTYVMGAREDAFGMQSIFVTTLLAQPFAYLLFVTTIDSPLSRPLRSRAAQIAIVLAGLAIEGYWLTHPLRFIPGMVHTWYAPWDAIVGDLFLVAWGLTGAVALFGLAVAVTAYRAAPEGSVARSRAKAYAIAFGVHDAIFFTLLVILPLFIPTPPAGSWTDALYIWSFCANGLLFTLLLGHGVLRWHLFDIDLKIKFVLDRAALAAIFLAVFFVVSQLIQAYATQTLGYIMGAVAAGIMLFAINPLQRMAERVADTAMPRVQATDEYLAFRKLQVYRAALEGAYEDGRITDAERAMLRRLQQELQIRPEDAARIESDLAGLPA